MSMPVSGPGALSQRTDTQAVTINVNNVNDE